MLQTPKIVMLTVSEIIAAPFNPPERTEAGRELKNLENAIREVGGILVPLLVSKDLRLIDGHRRLACAKRLGMVEVPAIILSMGLQEGWTMVSTTVMPPTGQQFVHASALGLSDEFLPKSKRRKIQRLRTLAGERYNELAAAGMSTTILDMVTRVARYTNDGSAEWQSLILFWLIDHKMQTPARKAIEGGIAPQTFADAIRRNKPIVQAWNIEGST